MTKRKAKASKNTKRKKESNDEFEVTCIYMGQGDCIHIKCPDATHIVIDCGTTGGLSGHEENFKAGMKNLLGGLPIDYLIITHSDVDHHNKIGLLADAGITVNNVITGNYDWVDEYFITHINPKQGSVKWTGIEIDNKIEEIDNYDANELWIKWQAKYDTINMHAKNYDTANLCALSLLHQRCACQHFTGLTISSEAADDEDDPNIPVAFKKTLNVVGDIGVNLIREDLGQHYYEVCGDTDGNGDEWSVRIVAAQVESDENKRSVYMNAASLVTVFTYSDKKMIFTGDSTGATFHYLLYDAPVNIRGIFQPDNTIDLLQIPHHGSSQHESNSQEFIDSTQPKKLFSSVKFDDIKYALPRWGALVRWKKNDNIFKGSEKVAQYIGYWITVEELSWKRILDNIDADTDSDDPLTINTVNKFLTANLGSTGSTYSFASLKAKSLDRWANLFAIRKKGASQVFVVQKTKKAIVTNGSVAVGNFLLSKIPMFVADRSAPIEIDVDELINTAFNNLSATQYVFTSSGLR